MINAFELILLSEFKKMWADVVAKVGTADDKIPHIFANLPAEGDFGANWKAIGDNFKKMATGNPQDDVSFVLQFPATKTQIPGIVVEVGAEMEDSVVGAFVEENYNQTTAKWERHIGGVWNKNYAVGVYSFNPDTTSYLYSLVKYGLLLMRNSLSDPSTLVFSGRPLMIDSQTFLPELVYIRYIDIRVEGLLDTAVEFYDKVVKADVEVKS